MNLTNLLKKETILLSLDATSKEECIQQLAKTLAKEGFLKDQASFIDSVLNRENTGSTGIGFGVAIPHGKSKGASTPGLAFARLAQPIDWQSLDGQPVSVVFMIAVPEENVGNEHLQILIALSRKLMHEDFRNKLLEAQTTEDVLATLQNI